MRQILLTLICVTLLSVSAEGKVRLHIIGDSTMADYAENTTQTRGWGEMLQEFIDSTQVQVVNYARGGRSSRSFHHEGLWEKVCQNIQPGDYVLVQFAHNDEKEGGKDGADFRGTEPWTTYRRYLGLYVSEARLHGAVPVFATPIVRRYFDDEGHITRKGRHDIGPSDNDSILNYVRVMKTVAKQMEVPLMDMTELTRAFVEQVGKDTTVKRIYVSTDGTHTQATGAAIYASLASAELKRMGILADAIKEQVGLVANPTSIDLGQIYVGESRVQCFDLIGLDLQPNAGELTIVAPKGMSVSVDSLQGTMREQRSLAYSDGRLWNRSFYLHVAPQENVQLNDSIVVSYGNQHKIIPVSAQSIVPNSQVPVVIDKFGQSTKGLDSSKGDTIISMEWAAEIDESASRYIEWVVKATDKTLMVKSIKFVLQGDVSYRVAYARGKDFYPRTDIGEEQRGSDGTHTVELPIGASVQKGTAMHIRFFPWRVKGGVASFQVSQVQLDALLVE